MIMEAYEVMKTMVFCHSCFISHPIPSSPAKIPLTRSLVYDYRLSW